MSVQLNGDLRHADFSLQHTCDDAAFGQGEMRCRGHVHRAAKASKSWRVALQNRTHPHVQKI